MSCPRSTLSMDLNKTYQHAHYPERFTCVPVAHTTKGAKVLQTETFPGGRKKPKVSTQFYDAADFGQANGLWIKKEEK
jgi:hypothetical protein